MSLRRPVAALAVLAALVVPALVLTPATSPAEAASTDACGVLKVKASGVAWECTFVDNFNGFGLDTDKWVVADTAVSGFTMNGSCFDGGGVVAGGGYLKLNVRKQTYVCTSPYGATTANYAGAGVSTFGKFSQTLGRWEARMRFPGHRGSGYHGGFWMNPQNLDYGVWPGSGEIDIAEWFSGVQDRVYPSLHYTGSTGLTDSGWNCVLTRPDLFHTYAVEWTADGFDFIYDGNVCFSRTWGLLDVGKPAPFDKPFTTSLVAASGGGLNAPTAATPFPAQTVVDYVKVWR